MDDPRRIVQAFTDALPLEHGAQLSDRVELSRALARLLADARAAWPRLQVELAAFVAHVAARLAPEDRLEALQAGDLYLAFACLQGERGALTEFERTAMSEVDRALARRGVDARMRDEIRQRVRERLLVSDGITPPKIAEYSGYGRLRHWTRVVAIRVFLNTLRSHSSEDRLEASLLVESSSSACPELEYLKRLYSREFETALRAAFAALSSRQRVLLRQYYLDHLTTIEMGALYRVHPVTTQRWLERARDCVAEETRRNLADRLKLPCSDVDSIVSLVRGEVEVSISTLLASN